MPSNAPTCAPVRYAQDRRPVLVALAAGAPSALRRTARAEARALGPFIVVRLFLIHRRMRPLC